MKQTPAKWAIIALFLLSGQTAFAHNSWLPIPKNLVSKIWHLYVLTQQKPMQNTAEKPICTVFSNEITITVGRCSDDLTKENVVQTKPVQ